ncbi:putative serine/threonine-protein kinase (LMTK1) [Operophtera brumata]|uniref:Putative serine/threonine-protein kinase (LMTK1) n=1 Tax=Operophtera brumata TaxID=104452 RepID=A0A0L7LVT7_OPEBR|nr:putative serine/threonine-protein kinase (LMTK1) [Operophtera brumata]
MGWLFTASASHIHTPQRLQPPDSGFSEPVNNNVSGEDNNNGPISLREMQNIANNNAGGYIFNENEERNANRFTNSRESIVLFDPLPVEIHVVVGEIENEGATQTVAVKILNQNASLEDKARFLEETRIYRELRHDQILQFLGKCLEEEPWLLLFELCTMDLQRYLVLNRPRMAILNESGVPLQLMSDVHALIDHLRTTHALVRAHATDDAHSDLYASSDFEDRWQRLKPNSIPKVDEHIAIVHAPSTSAAHFTESDHGFDNTLSVDMDTAVSRSSSIMSDKDPLESQIKSESLTNLHGSLEDVGNIYLTHNETATLECNQGNFLEEAREKENDRSDSSVDPWLKEIIAGSQDDVSYYRDVSDVIKNLDNILNSEKTSSSESSHQASPSRDNLSLDCKKDYPVQSSMVKSPGITNFQNLLDAGFASKDDETENDDELDRDTIGTLSHSFERHSDTASQHTLENLTPDTPMKDFEIAFEVENEIAVQGSVVEKSIEKNDELPKEIVDSKVPKLKELCVVSKPSLSEPVKEQLIVKDCETSCDSIRTDNEGTKSLVDVVNTESIPLEEIEINDYVQEQINKEMQVIIDVQTHTGEGTSKSEEVTQTISEDIRPEIDESRTETDELKTETDELRTKNEEQTKVDETQTKSEDLRTETDEIETATDEILTETYEVPPQSDEFLPEEDAILPVNKERINEEIDTLPSVTEEVSNATEASQLKLDSFDEPETTESENNYSKDETILVSDLIDIVTDSSKDPQDKKPESKLDITIAQKLMPEIVEKLIDDKKPIDSKEKKYYSLENIESKLTELKENEKVDTVDVNQDYIDSIDNKQENINSKEEHLDQIANQEHTDSKEENYYSMVVNHEPIDLKEEIVVSITQEPFDSDVTEKVDSMDQSQEQVGSKVISIGVNKEPIDSNKEIDKNQEVIDSKERERDSNISKNFESTTPTDLPPELVQNTNKTENLVDNENFNEKIDCKDDKAMSRSDSTVVIKMNEWSDDSTVYMDLICNTNSQILNSTVDNSEVFKDNKHREFIATPCYDSTSRNESTVYMDLPSFEVIKRTDDFINSEKLRNDFDENIIASTPIASDNSVNTLDALEKENETLVLSDSKAPDDGPGVTFTKSEQRYVPESMSPFDSPTKSHHTDTFDENSSVVLGSFENCSLELFKGVKSVEIPREELLAFSSNFSEINLETPSPLRDVNFLNEVPDIMADDNVFDDLISISEPREEPPSDTDGSGPSGTERRVSPSTPPNSPGIFASTSEPKYVVDIDLNEAAPEPDSSSLRDEIELNQIELQITSKMAIAENENNLNIEYSGPLTVEGLIEEGGMMRENDEIPESFLAGNGESLEDLRENLSLDEECVKALRNELELKLPLAQVASIEPQLEGDGEWSSELPPPPELVVTYPGALSPIQEETGQQLSAYDNDIQWNPSTRTDSSESYPEPCNNSTDEATELPTGNHEHTYTEVLHIKFLLRFLSISV